MSGDLLLLLTPLRQALERIERKAQPLLSDPALLNHEEGQDLLDVICIPRSRGGPQTTGEAQAWSAGGQLS